MKNWLEGRCRDTFVLPSFAIRMLRLKGETRTAFIVRYLSAGADRRNRGADNFAGTYHARSISSSFARHLLSVSASLCSISISDMTLLHCLLSISVSFNHTLTLARMLRHTHTNTHTHTDTHTLSLNLTPTLSPAVLQDCKHDSVI